MSNVNIKPLVEAANAAWAAKAHLMDWIPTTAEVAEYFLGCVPPIYGPAGFGCGEAYTNNAVGQPVYLSFRKINNRANTAEAKYCTRDEIKTQLVKQFRLLDDHNQDAIGCPVGRDNSHLARGFECVTPIDDLALGQQTKAVLSIAERKSAVFWIERTA